MGSKPLYSYTSNSFGKYKQSSNDQKEMSTHYTSEIETVKTIEIITKTLATLNNVS